tara:strand:- start:1259 stop:1534 length:276 start_codon:yes stop_codon:yes gene_type:complete
MVKKLQGEAFLLSANELRSGKVVFFTKKGWSRSICEAIKIKVDEIDKYEEISIREEKKCIIVSPKFVELDHAGNIKTLRDKIRNSGITIKI